MFWQTARQGAAGTLLISPLGLTPGVIFSAVRLIEPDRLIVLTSARARETLGPALEAAAWAGPDPLVWEMSDPHLGYEEIKDLTASQPIRAAIVTAERILANVTGGTTALQHAVDRLAASANKLGVPVRRSALVDRRPYPEQQQDPYVLGELIYLDPESAP